MKTLFAKLSLALLGIVLLTGSAFFLVERYSSQNYYEEITQRLNASIAMYVTGERQLIENNVVNDEALSLLAQQAMVINPTVEIYLLDRQGKILGHALPPESVQTDYVDLGPVQTLIGGEAQMPLRGTDPRNLERQKIFSAHPVMDGDQLQGDLFDLSRLESHSIHPALESFSLAELLQDISQEFELTAQQKDITIKVPGGPGDSMVYADIGLLQRVLENLIRNALKFTPAGGQISIELERKADCVAVAVSDTGCGIAESDLERVFDRFYHSDQSEDNATGSTGLGLAIVRKILDLHGSRITVSSVINEGTCFEFDLPTREAA